MWTCTDCGSPVPESEIHEHMQHEHGVNYSAPHPACPRCGDTEPCERVAALAGRD